MLEKYILAARRETKCDLVLKNATYLDVFSGIMRQGDIGIVEDRIVGVGEYSGKSEMDVSGKIVLPSYIDGHVHIESSQLSPEEYARLVVPRGTTAVIADPHEITNVCGMAGCEYIATASKNVPLDVFLQLPSCVPATPFETSGAILSGKDIEENISNDYIFGLGEFMNYPGIINADKDTIKKVEAALSLGKVIDGHAPQVSGYDLNAYLCAGITTDHECNTKEEIEEKISKGMYVHIRHGSSTHNLGNAKFVTAANMRRFLICADDRHAADLTHKGDIDNALKLLVEMGIDPIWAVTMATLNVAECYSLKFRGGIAPHYLADLVVVDDMKDFNARYVIKGGVLVAKDGEALFDTSKRYLPKSVLNTVHLPEMKSEDFTIQLMGKRAKAMTIKAGGVVTGKEIVEVGSQGGDVVLDGTDILKLFVVERHKLTGNIGRALFKGYGFKGGAMGITIAHDSHNVILLGDDNAALAMAANTLKAIGGGMVVVNSKTGEVNSLTLDIGGLMSSKDAVTLERESSMLISLAHAMGVRAEIEPFMSLAFLSLAVIPELKILDTGLFDVTKFAFTSLDEE